jgi:hypothetical protein
VTASIGKWSVDTANVPDWLTVAAGEDRATGDQFIVRAARNEGAARSFDLVIKAGDLAKALTIKQQAAPTASVSLSKTSWSAPQAVGSLAISVTVNRAKWQAATDQPWLYVSRTEGLTGALLVLGADSNPTSATRVGYVTVSAGTATKSVKVTQAAGSALNTFAWSGAQVVDAGANTVLFDTGLAAVGPWTLAVDASWLKASSGPVAGQVALVVNANTGAARDALVTLRKGSATVASFVVIQRGAGPGISLGATTWKPSAAGADTSRTVNVERSGDAAPGQWRAAANDPWLSVPEGWADSGTNLMIVADKNTTGVARTGSVLVESATGQAEVVVTQAAK